MDPDFDTLAEDVADMSIYYNQTSAKEKATRIEKQKKDNKIVIDQLTVPRSVLRDYRKLTASVNIMFVNKIPFLVSISHHISFKITQRLMTRTTDSILNDI